MCPIDQYHFAMYFSLIREETCDEESKSEYPEFTPRLDYDNLFHRCVWLASFDVPNAWHTINKTIPAESGLGMLSGNIITYTLIYRLNIRPQFF